MLLSLFSNNFSLLYCVTCLLIFHKIKKLIKPQSPWGLTAQMPLSQTMNVYKISSTFKYWHYFLYIYISIYMHMNTIYIYMYIVLQKYLQRLVLIVLRCVGGKKDLFQSMVAEGLKL